MKIGIVEKKDIINNIFDLLYNYDLKIKILNFI